MSLIDFDEDELSEVLQSSADDLSGGRDEIEKIKAEMRELKLQMQQTLKRDSGFQSSNASMINQLSNAEEASTTMGMSTPASSLRLAPTPRPRTRLRSTPAPPPTPISSQAVWTMSSERNLMDCLVEYGLPALEQQGSSTACRKKSTHPGASLHLAGGFTAGGGDPCKGKG